MDKGFSAQQINESMDNETVRPLLWRPLFGRTCWTCLNPPLTVKHTFCYIRTI